MAQLTSSPTTVALTNNPSWVPGPGQFASVSSANAASIDPCPARNCSYSSIQGFEAIWTSWNGGAYAPTLGTYGSMLFFGGGHASYDGNEVVAYDVAARSWSRLKEPALFSSDSGANVDADGSFPDGTPYPNHTNMGCDFLPPVGGGGRLGAYVFLGHGQTGVGISYNVLWRFDLDSRSWSRWRLPTKLGRFPALAYDSKRKGLWAFSAQYYDSNMPDAQNRRLFFIDVVNRTQTAIGVNAAGGLVSPNVYIPGIEYLESRDCLLLPLSGSDLQVSCIDLNGCVAGTTPWVPQFSITQSGTKCKSLWAYPQGGATGGDAYLNYAACERFSYCNEDGKAYVLDMTDSTACRLYALTPPQAGQLQSGTWNWSNETLVPKAGESLALLNNTVASVADKHLYGRFRYVPGIRNFILSDHCNLPAQALRPRAFA